MRPTAPPAPDLAPTAQAAREALAEQADGNGLTRHQVRLVRSESAEHLLDADLIVTSLPAEAVHDSAVQQRISTQIAADATRGWGMDQAEFDMDVAGRKARVFTAFTLRRQGVNEAVLEVVDRAGARAMALENMLEIGVADWAVEKDCLRLPLRAHLHLTRAEFSIEGRFFTAMLAGSAGGVADIDPFLDKWLKNGITALLKLSRGPLATGSLIATARKYRLLRDILQALTENRPRSVYQKMAKAYPKSVSDKYLRAAVKYADAAAGSLAVLPRREALVQGLIVSLALNIVYFYAGARALAGQYLPAQIDVALLDGVLAVFCLTLTIALMRRKMKRALRALIPAGPLARWRRLGLDGVYAFVGCFAISGGMTALAGVPLGRLLAMVGL